MKSAAKPYRTPTDGAAGREWQSASGRQPPEPIPTAGWCHQAVLQLHVATSLSPGDHRRQLPLHELPHALVLRRICEEEAESLEVSGGVGEQAPHG